MANLKNINDLPVAESAEGLNLIANDNGAAKQIPAEFIGKVKTVNGVEPDANGNIEIKTVAKLSEMENDLFYHKSNCIITLTEADFTEMMLAGANCMAYKGTLPENFTEDMEFGLVCEYENECYTHNISGFIKEGYNVYTDDLFTDNGYMFEDPEYGKYMLCDDCGVSVNWGANLEGEDPVAENIFYVVCLEEPPSAISVYTVNAKRISKSVLDIGDIKGRLRENEHGLDDVWGAVNEAKTVADEAKTAAENAGMNVYTAKVSGSTATVTNAPELKNGMLYLIVPNGQGSPSENASIVWNGTKYPVYAGLTGKGFKITAMTYTINGFALFAQNVPTVVLYNDNKKAFYSMNHVQVEGNIVTAGVPVCTDTDYPKYFLVTNSNGQSRRYPYMRVKSSTAGSSKLFDIRVDDNGTITAVEVTE